MINIYLIQMTTTNAFQRRGKRLLTFAKTVEETFGRGMTLSPVSSGRSVGKGGKSGKIDRMWLVNLWERMRRDRHDGWMEQRERARAMLRDRVAASSEDDCFCYSPSNMFLINWERRAAFSSISNCSLSLVSNLTIFASWCVVSVVVGGSFKMNEAFSLPSKV